MQKILLLFIRIYQISLSPLLGKNCRFYPSCSNYTYEAISLYGAFKGSYYSLKRIIRCQPFCQGGYDPVPDQKINKEDAARKKTR